MLIHELTVHTLRDQYDLFVKYTHMYINSKRPMLYSLFIARVMSLAHLYNRALLKYVVFFCKMHLNVDSRLYKPARNFEQYIKSFKYAGLTEKDILWYIKNYSGEMLKIIFTHPHYIVGIIRGPNIAISIMYDWFYLIKIDESYILPYMTHKKNEQLCIICDEMAHILDTNYEVLNITTLLGHGELLSRCEIAKKWSFEIARLCSKNIDYFELKISNVRRRNRI